MTRMTLEQIRALLRFKADPAGDCGSVHVGGSHRGH